MDCANRRGDFSPQNARAALRSAPFAEIASWHERWRSKLRFEIRRPMNDLIAASRLYRVLMMILAVPLMLIGAGYVVGHQVYTDLSIQAEFRHKYGPEWERKYEERHGVGSLSKARKKFAVAIISVPVVGTVIWLIRREIVGKSGGGRRSSRRRRRHRYEGV